MSSKSKKTTFNQKWLGESSFSPWLQQVTKDPFSAYCLACTTSFSLSNMGRQALISHMNGSKHKFAVSSRTKSASLKAFFNTPSTSSSQLGTTERAETTAVTATSLNTTVPSVLTPLPTDKNSENLNPPPRGLKTFLLKEQVTKAEVIWSIHAIMHHHSMRSSAASVTLFKTMFPDSEIANKIQLQWTKIAYTILYGIAPYFHQELVEMCTKCSHIVVGFDESLNKISQKGQMDISVRVWDLGTQEVTVRYFGSAFLGHATAADLLQAFIQVLEGLDLRKLLQVSMDGPNVNMKFHKDLKAYLQGDPDTPVLLQIGSCGLHAMHNAFKTGIKATDWNIVQFLRALHNLFHNVPARRADFIHYSGSTTFPLKFCAIRWLKNIKVAERAIAILPSIVKYVESIKKDKRSPACSSFKIVATAVQDKLLGPKLSFFQSLACEVEPFLRQFQSDAPLAPLLYESLNLTMRGVLSRFVKAEVMNTTQDTPKIDFSTKENLIAIKEIDLGFSTRDSLRRVRTSCSDREILEFRKNCDTAMETLCKKLTLRSPLQFRLTKAISCFDPQVAKRPAIRNKRIATALEIFVEHKWLAGTQADKIQRQFNIVCADANFLETIEKFSSADRLDHFWLRTVLREPETAPELTCFLKTIFTLSHGNASLERGFSINKECLIENLQEESLVAQRRVYDAVIANGGLDSLKITKPLILSARNAHSRYVEGLAKCRAQAQAEQLAKSEKKRAGIKLKELAAKKQKLMEEASKEVSVIEDEMQVLLKTSVNK